MCRSQYLTLILGDQKNRNTILRLSFHLRPIFMFGFVFRLIHSALRFVFGFLGMWHFFFFFFFFFSHFFFIFRHDSCFSALAFLWIHLLVLYDIQTLFVLSLPFYIFLICLFIYLFAAESMARETTFFALMENSQPVILISESILVFCLRHDSFGESRVFLSPFFVIVYF